MHEKTRRFYLTDLLPLDTLAERLKAALKEDPSEDDMETIQKLLLQ